MAITQDIVTFDRRGRADRTTEKKDSNIDFALQFSRELESLPVPFEDLTLGLSRNSLENSKRR